MLREINAEEAIKKYAEGETVLASIMEEEAEDGTLRFRPFESMVAVLMEGLRFLADVEEVDFGDIDTEGSAPESGGQGQEAPLRKARGRKKAAGKEEGI